LDKDFFGFSKNVLLLCSYVPPENSPFYRMSGFENGIDMLEDCIVDKLLFLGDVDVLLCGDINARTSNNLPNIMSERDLSNSHLKEDIEKDVRRCSQDKILNSYGKKLLNVCSVIGLYILNGVCNGDLKGHYTYISDTGCSVNDYFLASSDLFHSLRKRITLNVIERIESDHLPV
jgi:hypothetical protein